MKNNGHTIVADFPALKEDEKEAQYHINFQTEEVKTFTPLQFHFHAPSEHTINGKNLDLELHIVHYYKDTEDDEDGIKLGAVIGVFFDQ